MTPSKDWKETPGAGEDERFERLAKQLAAAHAAKDAGTRALHTKGHGGLRARLRVLGDLPEHARQGLFAEPREYDAYVRFSNGAGARQPDRSADLRGLALKVLGVDGPKVLGDARTQDLLMIDTPTIPFRTPDEFVAFVTAAAPPDGGIGRVFGALGFFPTLRLLAGLARAAKARPRNLLDRRFYSAAPIAFGPWAARYAAFPVHDAVAEPAAPPDADYLASRTAARVRQAPHAYEIRAQFFTGPETPIEDSGVDWPSPFVPVARLSLLVQDPASDAGKKLQAFVETLSFDPWHALIAHRPLGAAMRARKPAYYASTQARRAAPEPDGSEWASFESKG